MILFAGILMITSCKTSEPVLATSASDKTNVCNYIILIQLKDNEGTMNQVTAKVQEMISPLNVEVMEKRYVLSDSIAAVKVTTGFVPVNRVNMLTVALSKIYGVLNLKCIEMNGFKE